MNSWKTIFCTSHFVNELRKVLQVLCQSLSKNKTAWHISFVQCRQFSLFYYFYCIEIYRIRSEWIGRGTEGHRTRYNPSSVYFKKVIIKGSTMKQTNAIMKVSACQNICDVCSISSINNHAMALTLLTSPQIIHYEYIFYLIPYFSSITIYCEY